LLNSQDLPRFDSLKDKALRDANRGAILANIFEDIYDNVEEFALSTISCQFDRYLVGLDTLEIEKAIKAMDIHLEKRGFTIES